VLKCAPREPSAETLARVAALAGRQGAVWLAFLSPTAVVVWNELGARYQVMRELVGRARLAAQGNGTAKACEECFQRPPDFIPSVFVAEEFAKEFGDVVSASEAVIVPQSAEGRDVLAPSLAARGIAAESFSLYGLEAVTPPAELISRLAELPSESTAVVFMSPSAVRAAMKAAGDAIRSKRIVSVGPITSKEIRAHGLLVWAEAREHSEDGVVEVLAGLV
jgi:uroporphyrinogen-III synthase